MVVPARVNKLDLAEVEVDNLRNKEVEDIRLAAEAVDIPQYLDQVRYHFRLLRVHHLHHFLGNHNIV